MLSQHVPDTMIQKLEAASESERPGILNQVAEEISWEHPKKAMPYARMALDESKQQNNKREWINALLNIGDCYYYQEAYQEAGDYYARALSESKNENFPELIALSHYYLAYTYDFLNEKDQAEKHYLRAIQRYDSLGNHAMLADLYFYLAMLYDKNGENNKAKSGYEKSHMWYDSLGMKKDAADVLNSLGVLFYDWGEYEKAIEYYNRSMDMMRELDHADGVAQVMNNLGILYQNWNNPVEALRYYEESLRLEKESGDKYDMAGSYNNIGLIHTELEDYDRALEYYEKSLTIYEELSDKSGIATALNNLGELYSETGQSEMAILMLERSLGLEKENEDKYGIALAYATLSELHFKDENLLLSRKFNDSSMTLAREINNPEVLLAVWENYYKLDKSAGNYKQALDYYVKMTGLNDSLFSQKIHRQLTEVKARYELEQKEQEIALLNSRNKLNQLEIENKNNVVERQRLILYLALTALIIILVVLGILYKQIKEKKTAFKQIDRQNSELIQSREALMAAKEKAEESDRLKSIFLANMSHELRTPLNGILGFTEVLRTELLNEQFREMADIVHNSGNRLLDTLNSIIDLSIIESNRMEIDISAFNLVDFINETIALFRARAYKKNLQLAGDADQDVVIISDQKVIGNLLNNLIDNAIKYTESGSVNVTAFVENREDSEWLVMKVSDTGIGIEPERLHHIFDKFRQGSEGYDRQFEGAGIGLTICRKYVEILKGKISAKSVVDKGSEFIVEIPVKTGQPESFASGRTGDVFQSQTDSEGFRPEVLVVENDEINLKHLEYVLKGWAEACLVRNGNEAITKAENQQFDIILMDINLGAGPDGMETAKIIRAMKGFERIPIVAVTANTMKGHKEQFLANGCTHYISKPFSADRLREMILEAVGTK